MFLVAVSFGVLARPVMGAAPAVVMSIVVFAGAAQFASLSVLAAGGTAGAAVVAGLLMNARFLPMGFAAAPSLRGGSLARAAQGQAVVDASWALASRRDGTFDRGLLLGATIPQAFAWISGTIVGVFAGSSLAHPGYIIRLDPGANPPDTALAEIYKVPLPGYGIRGMDVDRNGVAWLPLDSGHLASFDRRKCKGPLNGPGAEKGEKCPEGFSFYALSGAGFQGDPGAEENPYYVWVDQHNSLGLGANVQLETGNQSDSLHALVDGHFVELRVPYPMGFFTKGLEGRIDDPNVGWKGRALWASSGNRTPQHIEGIDAPAPGAPGKSQATLSSPLVVQFQLRPDPLAH